MMYSIADQRLDPTSLLRLAGRKIYFGHHSVGYDIMVGVQEILSDNECREVRVVDSFDPRNYQGPMFGHSRVGYNGNPSSKNIGFSGFLDNLRHWKPDVAFFKYCYADIHSGTDAEVVFTAYSAILTELQQRYPHTAFIAVTAPLTTVRTGAVATVKCMLGRDKDTILANVRRNIFNWRLREAFAGVLPIFDLAAVESKRPDGRSQTFTYGGQTYAALYAPHTNDGGHLNSLGRRYVAFQLLRTLISSVT